MKEISITTKDGRIETYPFKQVHFDKESIEIIIDEGVTVVIGEDEYEDIKEILIK